MSIHSRWRRHRHAMSSLAVAALLTGSFGLTAIFATTQVASAAPTGDFIIPIGGSTTISGASWSACDPLSYGYELNGTQYPPLASKSGPDNCVGQTTPLPISGTTTIGPVTSQTTLTIYLTDDETSAQVPTAPTFTSDGNHALVSGTNPYTVDIADDAVGECGLSCSRVPADGQGNVSLTVTTIPPPLTGSPVTVGPATTNLPLPVTTSVATFVDPDSAATYNATISWGDTTAPSPGTIAPSGGG